MPLLGPIECGGREFDCLLPFNRYKRFRTAETTV